MGDGGTESLAGPTLCATAHGCNGAAS